MNFTERRREQMRVQALAEGKVNCAECGKPIEDMGANIGWCSRTCYDAYHAKETADETR